MVTATADTSLWTRALATAGQYTLRVQTPSCRGTGFVIAVGPGAAAIATAWHVVSHAHERLEPIRLIHDGTNTSTLLAPTDRRMYFSPDFDVALIRIDPAKIGIPQTPIPMLAPNQRLLAGFEVGWCGFPSMPENPLCFFSGRISAWIQSMGSYLIDGVAIHGVSGGPVFTPVAVDGRPMCQLVGMLTEYRPNRATGEALPGVSLARSLTLYAPLLEQLFGAPASLGAQGPSSSQPAPKVRPDV